MPIGEGERRLPVAIPRAEKPARGARGALRGMSRGAMRVVPRGASRLGGAADIGRRWSPVASESIDSHGGSVARRDQEISAPAAGAPGGRADGSS